MAEQGITDLEKSGLMYLSNDARARSRPRLPSVDIAACSQHLDITAMHHHAAPCGMRGNRPLVWLSPGPH